MKVVLNTLDGTQALDKVKGILEFEGTIVFACTDGIEYNSANDFPTMYSFEVFPETKQKG